jgi:hypothetical protein
VSTHDFAKKRGKFGGETSLMIIDEPEKDLIINLTKDVELLSPKMVPFEIGNALTRLKRRHILNEEEIIEAYNV